MKLTKSQLMQLIKEELQTALREEDDNVAAILSEFTPEEQEILRKDTGNLEQTMQIELDRLGDPAKLIKLMRSILAHGSYDARSAAKEAEKEERRRAELIAERCSHYEICSPEEMVQNHWGAILDNPGTLRDIRDDYDNIYKHWCNGGEEVEGYEGNLNSLPWLRELSPEKKKDFGCKWKIGMQDVIADGLASTRHVGEKERLRGELEDFLKHIGGLVYPKGELSPGSLVESKKLNKIQLKHMIKEAMTDHWDDRDKIAMSGMAEEEPQPEEEFSLDPEKIKQAKAGSIGGLFWSPDEQKARIAEFEEEYPGEDWQEHTESARRNRSHRERVAETITKSTLKDMIREAIRAIHE